jgi:hypothetical protein
MKQKLTYDHNNVSRHDIFRRLTNIPCKSMMMTMLSLLVLVMLGQIGHVELSKAQSDNMDMNPIIMHIHPQLSLLINNTSSSVPAQIGIEPSLWKDHSLDEFGMPSMPEMNMSAMAPLHTHDNSGIVHVESTINRNYTLEEFLNIWGLDLNDKAVKITVDGKPVNSLDYVLNDGDNIIMEITQQ